MRQGSGCHFTPRSNNLMHWDARSKLPCQYAAPMMDSMTSARTENENCDNCSHEK